MSDSKKIAIIRVFADFGGFTHAIRYPRDYLSNPDKYPHLQNLLTPSLHGMLYDWCLEFRMCASDDCFGGQHGRMLWVSFDLAGINISKAIKKHVGSKARVIYLKASEDPFGRYQYAREIMENGSVRDLPGDISGQYTD